MKKWFLVLLVGLALVLAACGQGNDKSSESKKESKKEQASDGNITYPQLTKEVKGNEKLVEMKTSMERSRSSSSPIKHRKPSRTS